MHHLLIPAIELAVGGVAWAWSRNRNRKPQAPVEWTGRRTIDLPLHTVRRTVRKYMSDGECVVVESDDTLDMYKRGDSSVRRVPWERNLRWGEVPVLIGTTFVNDAGKTFFYFKVWALPTVTFSPSGEAFFLRQAQAEFDAIVALLESQAQRERAGRASGNGRRPNHRWYPGDEEPQSGQEASPDGSLDADLALLGLKRGASWDDVQRAYRDACRKYHPDRLNGQNVEPHLVELAVQRFKEVTAAYRRLRDRMAQHQQS